MRDRALIAAGVVGGALVAICCVLAIGFGAVGLTAWLAKADYALIPALIICLGLIGNRPMSQARAARRSAWIAAT